MTDLDAYAAFLAARWDEIEQDLILRDTLAVGHALDCIYEGGWGGTSACDCGALDRARADLAAKRAILEAHPRKRDECSTCFDPDTAVGEYDFEGWPCVTVAALAEPFRDHPDHPGRRA